MKALPFSAHAGQIVLGNDHPIPGNFIRGTAAKLFDFRLVFRPWSAADLARTGTMRRFRHDNGKQVRDALTLRNPSVLIQTRSDQVMDATVKPA